MNVNLPPPGEYATGIIMMGADVAEKAEQIFGEIAEQCHIKVLSFKLSLPMNSAFQ